MKMVEVPKTAVISSEPRPQVEVKRVEQNPVNPVNPVRQQTPVQRVKRAGTISINDTEPQKKVSDAPVEVKNNPFTQAMLVDAWTKFVTNNKNTAPNFVAGIGKYQPTLGENFAIHYQVDNMLVVNDVQHMGQLREHLAKELGNNQFTLNHHIVEKPKDEVIYTDRSRFEKMAELNPNVITLKRGLGLNIDI